VEPTHFSGQRLLLEGRATLAPPSRRRRRSSLYASRRIYGPGRTRLAIPSGWRRRRPFRVCARHSNRIHRDDWPVCYPSLCSRMGSRPLYIGAAGTTSRPTRDSSPWLETEIGFFVAPAPRRKPFAEAASLTGRQSSNTRVLQTLGC